MFENINFDNPTFTIFKFITKIGLYAIFSLLVFAS